MSWDYFEKYHNLVNPINGLREKIPGREISPCVSNPTVNSKL